MNRSSLSDCRGRGRGPQAFKNEALSGYKMLAGLPMDCRPVPHSFALFANECVH